MQLPSKVNYNNKKKIINDPVYGFITIPQEIIFDVIEHPTFEKNQPVGTLTFGVSWGDSHPFSPRNWRDALDAKSNCHDSQKRT